MLINNDSLGTYNTNSQIKFKTTILKSSLCDYSNAYIFFKGIIRVAANTSAARDRNDKQVIFKNSAPFADSRNEINNTQVDSDNYSRTSEKLWYHRRNGPNNTLRDSESLRLKSKFINDTNAVDNSDVEKAIPLKYSSNFWRTRQIPLANFEINLMQTWSAICVISDLPVAITSALTDTKFNFSVVTL